MASSQVALTESEPEEESASEASETSPAGLAELDGELEKADFWGITSESVIEPMLSRNQLKVGDVRATLRQGHSYMKIL